MIEETLKKLHMCTEEHMEKQPLYADIKDENKYSNDNGLIQQSIIQFNVRLLITILYFFL